MLYPWLPHLLWMCVRTESFGCTEVVVSLSSPSCLRAPSPIQLLHAVSHRRIPGEDRARSSRLLSVLRNMKRPMQWAGLAANEQTVGGWLLPHTSAAGEPTGKETEAGHDEIFPFFFFNYFQIWTWCRGTEIAEKTGNEEGKVEKSHTAGSCSFSLCNKKQRQIFVCEKKNTEAFDFDQCYSQLRRCSLYWSHLSQ